MRLAFFDLDKTLIDVNSATLWIRRELREGNVSWWTALRGAFWIALYSVGFARMEPVLEEAIAGLKGLAVADVKARTKRFYDEEIQQRYRPGAQEAVRAHQAAGDVLVLLTSSSSFLSELVAEELGFAHVLCNRFEVRDGVLTGQKDGPLCFGAGKVGHAERLSTALSMPLRESVFYTDSYTDLPMLLKAGEPVAVHPDRPLRKEAQRRGWRIERWSGGDQVLPRAG